MKKIMQTISIITLFVMLGCSTDNANNNVNTTVTDVDGNVYPTVVIGTQTWTKINLNVSHYRNGDVIPQVTDQTQWNNLTTGAWCFYNNDPANEAVYGKLYNWYAVNDPRGLAPVGYHVQSKDEWTALIMFLGAQLAGGKMKSTGTSLWQNPNTSATNSSEFTGLPGGYCSTTFYNIGNLATFWSSSDVDRSFIAWSCTLYYNSGAASSINFGKTVGCSVRCIKD